MSELSIDELKEAIKVCEHYTECEFDLETDVLSTLLEILKEKQKNELGELESKLRDLASVCVLELVEAHSANYEKGESYLDKVVSIVQKYLAVKQSYIYKMEQIEEDRGL